MRLAGLLVLVALWPAGAAAQAQPVPQLPLSQFPAASFIGKRIVNVQFASEGLPVNDPALAGLIATRVGDPLSMAAVRESLSHLYSLGRFEDVQVEAGDQDGGVGLRFNLVPLHNVSRVEFRGELGISESQLRQAVTNRFGAAPPVGRAADVAATIESLYHDDGYLTPRIEWRPRVEHNPDRTVLTFEIQSGPRAKIGRVEIIGDPLMGRAAFLREVDCAPGAAYAPLRIRRDLDQYERRLRKKGRYEARATYAPRQSQAGTVDVTFDVDPGPIVKVTFEGDPIPPDRLTAFVLDPVQREGSVDQDLLEDAAGRIVGYLKQQGYWKASVKPERRPHDASLAVVFTIHKGSQYRVAPGGLQITGAVAVSLELLRPLLAKLQSGELFLESNLTAVQKGI
jgi:outer membrane protein insertion porin family